MKTLILGEILNETLSSGTLEIIKKAQDENLDFQVITIGSGIPSTACILSNSNALARYASLCQELSLIHI